jgi:hypothetical protein
MKEAHGEGIAVHNGTPEGKSFSSRPALPGVQAAHESLRLSCFSRRPCPRLLIFAAQSQAAQLLTGW